MASPAERTRVRLRTLAAAALLSLAILVLHPGCTADSAQEAGASYQDDTHNDAATDTPTDTIEPTTAEHHIRIDDLTDATRAEGGVKIDSIVLSKASGETFYAVEVEWYAHGQGAQYAEDAITTSVTGPPDATDAPADKDTGCDPAIGETVMPLGGLGGTLIVGLELGTKVEPGDTVTIVTARCDLEGGGAILDRDEIFVSVCGESLAACDILGGGNGPRAAFKVPE